MKRETSSSGAAEITFKDIQKAYAEYPNRIQAAMDVRVDQIIEEIMRMALAAANRGADYEGVWFDREGEDIDTYILMHVPDRLNKMGLTCEAGRIPAKPNDSSSLKLHFTVRGWASRSRQGSG